MSLRMIITGACLLALACTPGENEGEGGTESGAPSCVDIDYTGCSMLYPATYDQVWSQTLAPTCGGGGSSCHPSGVPLTFQDPAITHGQLLDHEFVIPGDPACSELMVRLESDDPGVRMPPGNTAIPEGARCSIATWIAEGAAQN